MQNLKKWEVRQRLEFIESRLYWNEKLNRGDLVNVFGISILQASKDIAQYQELAPGNMDYDTKLRQYSISKNFQPKLIHPDAEAYLAQLQAVIGNPALPEINIIPTPVRKIDVDVLRTVLRAVREEQEINVYYQSMTRPQPIWRWIAPHALSFDGLRWHTRAYCHETSSFRDFLLSRILKIDGQRERSIDPRQDQDWHQYKTIKIAPHPELTDAQKETIAFDYGMKNGFLEIKVRVASVHYFLKRLGLDEKAPSRKAEEQQIILLNAEEILPRQLLQ